MIGFMLARVYQCTQQLYFNKLRMVYKVYDKRKQKLLAAKLQRSQFNLDPKINNQIKILRLLSSPSFNGFLQVFNCRIYYTGVEEEFTYMITDLLGDSLQKLFWKGENKIDLKTTLLFGLQALDRLELLHQKKIIHCQICPKNFVVDYKSKNNWIYLIGFSYSKQYIGINQKHIPYRDNIKLISNNPVFSSINTQIGIEASRRDDIESLCYIIIYLLKGKLPWSHFIYQKQTLSDKQINDMIVDKKLDIPPNILCKELPIQIQHFLEEARNLYFQQKPDYIFFKKLLKSIMEKQKFLDDNYYCWNKQDYGWKVMKQYEAQREIEQNNKISLQKKMSRKLSQKIEQHQYNEGSIKIKQKQQI